jgi:transposase
LLQKYSFNPGGKMAAERLAMNKIRKLLELRFKLELSQRQTAKALGCGRTSVQRYENLAIEASLTDFNLVSTLSEEELFLRLGLKCDVLSPLRKEKQIPIWPDIYKEFSKKHVTLSLLWQEYKEDHPEGYQYSQFCEHFSRWREKLTVSMRQEHKAGEKAFIDYAGTTVDIIDRKTGEVHASQIFVGVLGASSYTYVEATWSQSLPDWLMSHRRMFEFFDGVPSILVPDNLRSGITKPDRYEATVNKSYQDLSEYYGTCVIPARVRKPKDKAKAEAGVLLASRWILAVLRNKTFYSLDELNEDIAVLLEKLNNKKMRHFKKSRRELFEMIDKPALMPLRSSPYVFAEWKWATVSIDYHIEFDGHFYSAPYQLVKKEIQVRATSVTVEIFYKSNRVASHPRSYQKGGFKTEPSHRPPSHNAHLEWTPERIINWAKKKGSNTGIFIQKLIATKAHPEQGYRSALGVIRLSDKFGEARLDQACNNAIAIGSYSYRTVKNMLNNGMDKVALPSKIKEEKQQDFFVSNENVRGKEYYH